MICVRVVQIDPLAHISVPVPDPEPEPEPDFEFHGDMDFITRNHQNMMAHSL